MNNNPADCDNCVPIDSIVNLFSKRLKKIYGDTVDIVFIDIFDCENQNTFPQIWKMIRENQVNVPVVTVNMNIATHGEIAIAPVQNILNQTKG